MSNKTKTTITNKLVKFLGKRGCAKKKYIFIISNLNSDFQFFEN